MRGDRWRTAAAQMLAINAEAVNDRSRPVPTPVALWAVVARLWLATRIGFCDPTGGSACRWRLQRSAPAERGLFCARDAQGAA